MEMSGTRVITADRETVWEALNSADVLKECIPGCTELTGTPEDGFDAVVTQKVGPVKATFKGSVSLSDIVRPESYRISGEGKGGVAGFAKGGASVQLNEIPEGTELVYEVDAKVGGKIAQLGNRIINGFATKMANAFFDNFQAHVQGDTAEAETA